MSDNINLKKKISNAKGLRNLEQTKLKYSKAILSLLEDNPNLLDELLQDLDVTDDDFFRKITALGLDIQLLGRRLSVRQNMLLENTDLSNCFEFHFQ